jgi:hypothetical protein
VGIESAWINIVTLSMSKVFLEMPYTWHNYYVWVEIDGVWINIVTLSMSKVLVIVYYTTIAMGWLLQIFVSM